MQKLQRASGGCELVRMHGGSAPERQMMNLTGAPDIAQQSWLTSKFGWHREFSRPSGMGAFLFVVLCEFGNLGGTARGEARPKEDTSPILFF